jgi:hypothetical protein
MSLIVIYIIYVLIVLQVISALSLVEESKTLPIRAMNPRRHQQAGKCGLM